MSLGSVKKTQTCQTLSRNVFLCVFAAESLSCVLCVFMEIVTVACLAAGRLQGGAAVCPVGRPDFRSAASHPSTEGGV